MLIAWEGNEAHQLILFFVGYIARVNCLVFAKRIDSLWDCSNRIVVVCLYVFWYKKKFVKWKKKKNMLNMLIVQKNSHQLKLLIKVLKVHYM